MQSPVDNRIGAVEAQLSGARETMQRCIDEFEVARRALKWLLEHRAYWSPGSQSLRSAHGGDLCAAPPADIHVFIVQLAREISLDAEHAG